MLAQSTSWNLRMASMTAKGFCAVAALSRYTSGLPWIVCFRTGKSWRTRSTSNVVETWLLRVLIEFLEQDPLERVPQCRYLDAVHNVLREGVGQQTASVTLVDAARLHVEQRLGVELADGGAVGAFDVVGPDLKLGLGVDDGLVGQHEVLVGLLGVGLLRILANNDAAVEDRGCLAVQNALVQLVAVGVRLGVVDRGVIVDVLRAVNDVEAVERRFRAVRQGRARVVADQGAA